MAWLRRISWGLAAVAGALLLVLGALALWGLPVQMPPEPALGGRVERGTLRVDGRLRSYRFYRPATLREGAALLFVLHGSMGDGALARRSTAWAFDRLADRAAVGRGFVAVYPDGYDGHWNDCRARGPYEANRLDVDDVGFLRALAAKLHGELGTDPQLVFATGISNGGQMALRLALEVPGFVRGVAPVAASMPVAADSDCDERPGAVAFALVNGTRDPMNPYDGGTVALYGLWGNRGRVLSTHETLRHFARRAGHTGGPRVEPLPDRDPDDGSHVVLYRWRAPGLPEVLGVEVVGGGHNFPQPGVRWPRLLGPSNRDFDAARLIWDFFARAGGLPVVAGVAR